MDDDEITYNTAWSPWYRDAGETRRGLTCSDWAMLAYFGIYENNSKWYKDTNECYPLADKYKELFKLKSGDYGGAVWSEQIGKFLDENGMLYEVNTDLSNVHPGDILFYDLSEDNDDDEMYYPPTDETLTRYKGIDHTAVFVGRVTENRYAVLEVPNADGVVYKFNTANNDRKIVGALRTPYKDGKNHN